MTGNRYVFVCAAVVAALGLPQAAAVAFGCTVGVSEVPCEKTLRAIVVAQSGSAHYRSIQQAVKAAIPGDTIFVRAGVYNERVIMGVSGTVNAPITLRAYPNERPIITATGPYDQDSIRLNASWLIVDGFEITKGRHGIQVTQPNNIIRNNWIHEMGVACGGASDCGYQGIVIASTSHVLIQNNLIERNGLTAPSPYLQHGIYVSDYYRRGTSRISIMGNVLREHGGSGLQVWDLTTVTPDLLIQGNRFENNANELILTNVANVIVKSNTFIHNSFPATDANKSSIVWLSLSNSVVLQGNLFHFGFTTAQAIPVYLIWVWDQDLAQLSWQSNTWEIPSMFPQIRDDVLNSLATLARK